MNDKLSTELFASVNSNAVNTYKKSLHIRNRRNRQIQRKADIEFSIYTAVLTATVLITGFAF
jgi:hypothetical protein